MPLLFLFYQWPTSFSVWAESLKTLDNSSILPFGGSGGDYSESKYAGNAGQGGCPASTLPMNRLAPQAGRAAQARDTIMTFKHHFPSRCSGQVFLYILSYPSKSAQEHEERRILSQVENLKHKTGRQLEAMC